MGGSRAGAYGLAACGLMNTGQQVWNPGEAELAAQVVTGDDGGAPLTGDDRFVVQGFATMDRVAWSEHNRPFSPTTCSRVWGRIQAILQGRGVFVVEGFVGTDPQDRTAVRVVADRAVDALHAIRWLVPGPAGADAVFLPDLTVIVASSMQASPQIDGTAGRRFCILDLDRAMVLVGGPCASSEWSDAVSKAAGFARSREGVVALRGAAGDFGGKSALFLGLSGTGRTCLASGLGEITGDGAILWTDSGLDPLGRGRAIGHPAHVAILVADATGTLPALARLTPEQAALWFAVGYAAAREGVAFGETTESGLAFSPGSGARHHLLPAAVVVDRLLAKLRRHVSVCWLVDTGWPDGGPARRPVAQTLALLGDAFAGHLSGWRRDPVFGFEVAAGVEDGGRPGAGLARRVIDVAGRMNGLATDVQAVLPSFALQGETISTFER